MPAHRMHPMPDAAAVRRMFAAQAPAIVRAPAAASTLSVCGSPHSCPVARSTTAEQTWLPPMSTPRA